MSGQRFYDKAKEILNDATRLDNAKDFAGALPLYTAGIENMLQGMRFDTDPAFASRRATAKTYTESYMKRAEELKKLLKDGADGSSATGGGSGGATASRPPGEAGAGDDAEKEKLKGALAGAIVMEKPDIKWADVAGLEAAKDALKEAVILPVKFPQLFQGKRKPWKGILLYGPPGTGKSHLAKAVATEADSTFFSISSSDLVSKWQGESERLVRNLFEMAREKKPSIVFIDEIDSLCGARGEGNESESARRIKTEFLTQMQGVGRSTEGVLVLAATNVPWEIDGAMRRRFEKRIYISLPDAPARATMFKINLGDTPNDVTDEAFAQLGMRTEGYSGSDIATVVREALMEPLRKCRTAKFFRRDLRTGGYEPLMDNPPCARCPLDLSTAPAPRGKAFPCAACGACRVSLYDLESHELQVPIVTMADFQHVLVKSKPTVAARELVRYVDFTRQFGQDGAEGGGGGDDEGGAAAGAGGGVDE